MLDLPPIQLLDFFPSIETPPDESIPLTFTQVVIVYENQTLLLYNPERGQWELPGGGIEVGETVLACAIREVMEETSQQIENLVYRGLFKVRLHDGRCEYGGLYTAVLQEVRPHLPNPESEKIMFWNRVDALDARLSSIGLNLFSYCD